MRNLKRMLAFYMGAVMTCQAAVFAASEAEEVQPAAVAEAVAVAEAAEAAAVGGENSEGGYETQKRDFPW